MEGREEEELEQKSSSSASSSQPEPGPGHAGARVMIWCSPRSTSNLFAKCLTAIEGMEVWIEPYQYAQFAFCEMKRAGLRCKAEAAAADCDDDADMPLAYEGNEEAFGKAAEGITAFLQCEVVPQRLPYASVKRSLERSDSKHVFVKDMGAGVPSDALRQFLPAGYKHTFLIRHPLLAFRSYRKALVGQLTQASGLGAEQAADFESSFDITVKDGAAPSAAEFYQRNYELWNYVRERIDPHPVVIDSSDLLRDPARMMAKYCAAVGLPYSDSLLAWESTPDSYRTWRFACDEFPINVESFLGTLFKTTGFLPAPAEIPPRDELSRDVVESADAAMPYYDAMYATRIT